VRSALSRCAGCGSLSRAAGKGWGGGIERTALAALAVLLAPCSSPAPAPVAAPSAEERATREVKRYVDAQVAELAAASEAICAAAPEPDADGWSAAADPEAVAAMRAAWRRARTAYERIEGAIGILFPETDLAIDARYEHVVELRADPEPFDGHGFVGLHAIERVLWAESVPEAVLGFERALAHYVAARAPSSEVEARSFREGLCARLVRDVRGMEEALRPLALDPATAWRGVVGSVEEQVEKVLLGATGEDESRYSQSTLADMRANLEGGRAVLAAFAPMIEANAGAAARRADIDARFDELERAYADVEGVALPEVPAGFDPDAPGAALATPYGRLFGLLSDASDPLEAGSLAATLRAAGEDMGIPPLAR
jgi:iron uptake system component EfeO